MGRRGRRLPDPREAAGRARPPPLPSLPPRGPALARLSAPPAQAARPGDAIQHGAAAGGARAGEGKGEPTLRGALAHIHARPPPRRLGRPRAESTGGSRAAARRPPASFPASLPLCRRQRRRHGRAASAAQRPPRAGRGTAPGSTPPRQLLAGNNRLGSPGLGFICNVPHISHAHKAGGKGGGAGKRPLPVVPGLGVEAMFASPARLLEGPPLSPCQPDTTGLALGREGKLRGAAPHATHHSQIGIKSYLLPFFFFSPRSKGIGFSEPCASILGPD
ncbi:atherin-like [Panthera leo]|uniref:atherin-like n=1 Tax=Panthera leo TaxID=9689 RepID=UPI001C6978F1|nr:atherin-like [Panthera leo]